MEGRHSFVDFGIITALPEEFDALRKVLGKTREIQVDAFTFYRATVPIAAKYGRGHYEVVATFLHRMGPLDAANLTNKLIQHWSPKHIIMVGIAGSFHHSIKLADVVVGRDVLLYDPGKETEDGTEYRPEQYPTNLLLVNRVLTFMADKKALSAWQGQCLRTLNKPDTEPPQLHVGTIASGSKVIASSEMKEELKQLHAKIYAVEMEAAGVLAAAYHNADPARAIIIRGISDAADENKSKVDEQQIWRKAAANNAALFTVALLRRGPVEPLFADSFSLNLRLGLPSEALQELHSDVDGCYLVFPSLIENRGPITEIDIRMDAWDAQKQPLRVLEAITKYKDVNGKEARNHGERSGNLASFKLDKALPSSVALYAKVDGDVATVNFMVKTHTHKKKGTWTKATLNEGRKT